MIFDTSKKILQSSLVITVFLSIMLLTLGRSPILLAYILLPVVNYAGVTVFFYEIFSSDKKNGQQITENTKLIKLSKFLFLIYFVISFLSFSITRDIARFIMVLISLILLISLPLVDVQPENKFDHKLKHFIILVMGVNLINEFYGIPLYIIPSVREFMFSTFTGDLIRILIDLSHIPITFLLAIRYFRSIVT